MFTESKQEIFKETASGKHCELRWPVRDHKGRIRFHEKPLILSEVHNLGREMFLVRFADGATTFVFPHEIVILES
jgi:hypothetical protein